MIVSPARATHRQSLAMRLLVTLLFLIAAVAVLAIADGNYTPAVIAAVVLLAALDVAVWILVGKTVLTIHDEGIRRVTAFGAKEIEFHNVAEYHYRAVPVRTHAGGALGFLIVAAVNQAGGRKLTTNLYLELVDKDGVKINVTSSFKDAYEAIGVILAAVHDQLRPQIAKEIASTGATFGPVRLSARDLQWKAKEPVPLREISSAELAGQMLSIRKTGKMFSLVSVRSDKVPNVLLLLEQMEVLGVGASRLRSIDPLAKVRT
jgi:hypothetical protein